MFPAIFLIYDHPFNKIKYRLYGRCSEYLAAGAIGAQALQNLDCVYSAYHALGGNGTGTQLYRRVQALPIRTEKE